MAVLAQAEQAGIRRPAALAWLTEASPVSKRTLLAASFGWMLDSFDVMLYSLVLPYLMKDLNLTKTEAGILGSVTLVAAAAGGLAFGIIADRRGRTVALRWSVLVYAVFTAACGTAQNLAQLILFRVCLGLGMGGEWASGAALVAETWPAEHRGKAIGLMQSSWAIGFALATLTAAVLLPFVGWRGVFFVGLVPAIFTIWIRRNVPEPGDGPRGRKDSGQKEAGLLDGVRELFRGHLRKLTITITLMNACALFAWWGFNLWVPGYLKLALSQGGAGFSSRTMTILVLAMQAGMWLGYVSFGAASDAFGRKRCYVFYLGVAACSLFAYSVTKSAILLLLLGPVVAFFGTGYFAGFGTVTAEIYHSRIRATAQGFTYNAGRLASAVAPFTVGSLAEKHGFGVAFRISALFFLLAASFWAFLPETKPDRVAIEV